jgi:hypothetical protein
MQKIRISFTTATDGSATAYGEACKGTLYAAQLVDGDLADGVDLTLTCENADLAIPLLVIADFNTDQMSYPRVLQNLNTDGSALSTHCEPLVFGRPKAVIASGGSLKSGAVVLYIREL